ITERDTLYVRTMKDLFQSVGVPEDNLHVFSYLHGLDGQLPGEKNERQGANNDRVEASVRKNRDDAIERDRPEGRSQIDYLRRLEHLLQRLQGDLRVGNRRTRGRITAVGIVG